MIEFFRFDYDSSITFFDTEVLKKFKNLAVLDLSGTCSQRQTPEVANGVSDMEHWHMGDLGDKKYNTRNTKRRKKN